ncbi:hypothetical protein EJ02DRAFT_55532 [Clathrospora elynae]|uniref:Uncharacterized protein n=1 Tax=Clathrospora elynae TaxID=706981 RepID=A0A6A5SBX2_9PLEO|nr:hypothetical protein EJ02DRAFT_55532 [Clathrospora elynae]
MADTHNTARRHSNCPTYKGYTAAALLERLLYITQHLHKLASKSSTTFPYRCYVYKLHYQLHTMFFQAVPASFSGHERSFSMLAGGKQPDLGGSLKKGIQRFTSVIGRRVDRQVLGIQMRASDTSSSSSDSVPSSRFS